MLLDPLRVLLSRFDFRFAYSRIQENSSSSKAVISLYIDVLCSTFGASQSENAREPFNVVIVFDKK